MKNVSYTQLVFTDYLIYFFEFFRNVDRLRAFRNAFTTFNT